MICSNGLHIADTEIQFSIRHTRNNTDLIMLGITELFDRFLDNEYYSITGKFEKMMEVELVDTKAFVKEILLKSKLFRYECSDKNPDPSKKARGVLEILDNEALALNEEPNLWLGYNALNQVLHGTLKKGFSQQERLDRKLFDLVCEMV